VKDPAGSPGAPLPPADAKGRGELIYQVMDEQANFAGALPLEKLRLEIFRRGEEVLPPNTLPLSAIAVVKKHNEVHISVKYTETTLVNGRPSVYTFDKTVKKPVF
jgi:hypothetical protein